MTTFTVEIHEDIVIWLERNTRPEIVLDLPSVPEPGDKLWLKSMRGTHLVETERCTIVKLRRVSRLCPTVCLVLVSGVTTRGRKQDSVRGLLPLKRLKRPPFAVKSEPSYIIYTKCA
ncbi:Uncharacterised protein [Klebsiella pneumoniae]|nr:Uncharacterised protein [Klebsiella pneumoniae]VUI13755.1 Uncharacterised protein [Klebsiella pneumoniae]